MSVDSESRFSSLSSQSIPKDSKVKNSFGWEKARKAVVNNQVLTLYLNLPVFTDDFTYLDGLDCEVDRALGDINGYSLSFGDDSKTYGFP